MPNTAFKFEPQQDQGRSLAVRWNSKFSVFLFSLLGVYFFALGTGLPTVMILQGQWEATIPFLMSEGLAYLLFSGVFISMSVVSYRLRVPFKSVDVSRWGLKLQGPFYRQEIPFQDVASVRFEKRPLAFSHLIIERKDGVDFHFPYHIERSEYILDTLNKARPDLAKVISADRFRQEAIISDHRISRWEGRTTSFMLRTVFLGPAMAVGAFLTFNWYLPHFAQATQGDLALYWVATDWVRLVTFDLMALIGIETLFSLKIKRQLKNDPTHATRDRALEQKFFRWHWALYFAFGLIPYLIIGFSR